MIDFSAKLCRAIFPSVTYTVPDSAVHLTFDDGPHPIATPKVLDILHTFNVKATFFLVGFKAQRSPELVREIIAQGHAIGNHTFNHANLLFRGKMFVRREITMTNDFIRQISGFTPTMFRPPFGYFDLTTLTIVKSLAMRLIHWSNDLRDFEIHNSGKNIVALGRRVGKGSIVLLHDNEATADRVDSFLPATIRAIAESGLVFSSLE
jgi:peptidoglycan/xylan/chitin deacetylase (PgdA/CDA1 family)